MENFMHLSVFYKIKKMNFKRISIPMEYYKKLIYPSKNIDYE